MQPPLNSFKAQKNNDKIKINLGMGRELPMPH